MIHQINPNENFPVARQLEDPSDASTNYVQAKVYNGSDNSLITTLNLTDQGSQLFTKIYQAPGDSSGNGRYIYIITRVYTDAAYTNISSRYGIALDTYLIQYRVNPTGFTGGGSYYDYGKMEKIMRKAIEELVAKIVKREIEPIAKKKTDFSELMDRIASAAESVKRKILPFPQIDLAGIAASQAKIEKSVRETGMGVVASSGELHGATRKQIREAIREIAAGITEKITEHYEEIVDRVNADRDKFEDRIMRQVSGVVEENFGKTSFQVVYSGKDGKSPGTKITPEQEKKARELLRKGVSREKIIEEIFA